MNITFQAVNFKADKKLINFITEKVNKLDLFYDKIVDAIVFLKLDNNSTNSNKIIELKLNVSSATLFVTEIHSSFEAACDVSVDAMRNQLMKYKGRKQAQKNI